MVCKKTGALALLAGMVLAAGCRTEGPSPAVTNPDVLPAFNTVVVLDKSVTDWTKWLPWEKQSKITIDRNRKTVTPTGLMGVDIAIRNRTEREIRVDVQTKYFAADDRQIDETPRQTIVIRPQDTRPYSSSSLRREAAKYRVEISGAD